MKLGIVGGGGASVALLAALTREQIPPIDITLFEADAKVGPGRAYLSDSDTSLLNVTAQRMSLFPDMPNDFLNWLIKNRVLGVATDSINHSDYLPRHLFGTYLEQSVSEIAQRVSHSGQRLDLQRATVTHASQELSSLTLTTDDRRCFTGFDRVVLCVGVGAPDAIQNLRGHQNYIDDPYPLRDRLAQIEQGQDVVIVGTGLTAVDVTLFLLDSGHKGQITLVSRSGLLPSVRTRTIASELRFLSKAALHKHLTADPVMTLDRLFALFEAELQAVGLLLEQVCTEAKPGEDFRLRLRRQLQHAETDGALWQPIMIKAMHEAVECIWHAMPPTDCRRFLREWHTKFISLLSPIPQMTASKLLAAADSGQLTVERCHSSSGMAPDPAGGFRVQLIEGHMATNVIVNTIRATKAAIPKRAGHLVKCLTASGTARLHSLGGLDIDPSSNNLLDINGRKNVRLFALGQLTAGVHYYTSSMLKISQQATVIADQIIADASHLSQNSSIKLTKGLVE